jgi:uncharacterized protein (DUF305 family)
VPRSRQITIAVAAAAALVAGIVTGFVVNGGSGDDAGGGGDDDVRTVQPGAPGEEGRELTDDEAAAIGSPEHTAADTAFMQDMIAHHQQALDMASLVADRTGRDDLPLLAERIIESQEAEIELIEQWLTDRDEEIPDEAADHEEHEGMPGMATADQLDDLGAAEGTAFDRLFLELMIAHHQGAVTMVTDLYAGDGGLEPAADSLARGIEADQNIEIRRMQDLLESMA